MSAVYCSTELPVILVANSKIIFKTINLFAMYNSNLIINCSLSNIVVFHNNCDSVSNVFAAHIMLLW